MYNAHEMTRYTYINRD